VDKLFSSLAGLSFLILTSCVPFTSNGTRHTLVLGFGIVSMPATNTAVAQITKTQAIGFVLSDQPGIKAGIGYTSSIVTQIGTNQNILVEVSTKPFRVKSQSP
jgi:hypothetical protein